MNKETTALTVAENNVVTNNATMSVADVLRSEGVWNRAHAMGQALMKTSYLGSGTSEFGATMAVITMAKNNMDPVEFSQAYNMIKDKPEMKPNYALGLFKRAGGHYKMNRVDEDVCDMEFTAPDGTSGHFVVRMDKMLETSVPWTQDSAGNRVLKSNWANHPDDMLFARCTGKALRRVWPEHMGGMHLFGEIEHEETTAKRKVVSREDVIECVKKCENQRKDAACAAEDKHTEENVKAPGDVIDVDVVDVEKNGCVSDVKTVTATDTTSFDTCPIQGPFYNVRFDEMEPDTLTYLLAPNVAQNHKELTEEHIKNVRAALSKFDI